MNEQLFKLACEQFQALGVDVEAALQKLEQIPIAIHAWQGDDVHGFESTGHALTGGCQVTGNYPGCARTAEELRADLDLAISLIPGSKLRVCLQGHQVDCLEAGQDRDSYSMKNFAGWLEWAKQKKLGMDIAPAYYGHPKLDNGLSLSHPDAAVRNFWINHGKACRRIAAQFSSELNAGPSVCNQWAPDGYKDTPADRYAPRVRLAESLDEIFSEEIPKSQLLDAVEPKLFGIGVESYTVGSADFYLTYAARRNKLICLDTGHFHPTESIADKISAICCQQGEILLHVSRGVRWDSDHVCVLNDDLKNLMAEVVAYNNLEKVQLCLDYFDGSINRVAAWVIGTRATQKALLMALLTPKCAAEAEAKFDFTARMAMQERDKNLPYGIVWEYFLASRGIPSDSAMLQPIRAYEEDVLLARG
ncbi:MAG: L-rhamnose isomerase [Victivallales bacterium]|nr:L-rhamnose isomerase [Victivallales bacterium]